MMVALKEFANFVNLNRANLAATYARLLEESDERYKTFPGDSRIAFARKLLKAVVEACESETSGPIYRLFNESISKDHPWLRQSKPAQFLIEIECLGQTLTPVVTNLEAGKFLWQTLSEVRATILPTLTSQPGPVSGFAAAGEVNRESTGHKQFKQLRPESPEQDLRDREEQPRLFVEYNSVTGTRFDHEMSQQVEIALAKRAVELETVAQVSAAAASTLEVEKLLQIAVDLTKSGFNLYHAHIYLLNEAGDSLNLTVGAGEVGRQMVAEGWSIPLAQEQSLVAQAARTRQGIIANNVRENPDWLPNPLLPETRAEMALPMIAGDDVLGVIDMQSEAVDHFTQEDVRIKTILAAQVAIAVQNARLFSQMQRALADMQQSQHLLQSVIDATPDWIFVKDQQHRYRLVNQGYAYSLHLAPDDFIDKNDLELGFPEEIVKGNPEKDIRGFWTDDRRVMDSGEPLIIEAEPAMVDGKLIILSTIKAPLRDATGNIWGVLGFARNITEREQLLAETRLLYEIGAQLNTATTLEEIIKVVALPEIAPDAHNIALSTFDLDAAGQPEWSELAAIWTPTEMVADAFAMPIGTRFYLPDIPLANLWINDPHKPILISDIAQDERIDPALRALYAQAQAQATVLIPLTFGGQWVGLISLVWSTPYTFTERDQRLYKSLAAQMAITIHNRLLFNQTQERTAQLEQLAQIEVALSQAVNEEEILAAVVLSLKGDQSASVALNYLEIDADGRPLTARAVASWRDNAVWVEDPFLNVVFELDTVSVTELWINKPGTVVFVENIFNDPRIDERSRDSATQFGMKAIAVIPLQGGGRWQGIIIFIWAEPHRFSPAEQFVFRQLLEPVAAVVTSRRTYLAQQASLVLTENLYKAGQRINEANDLQEIVAAVAEAVPVPNINRAVLMLTEHNMMGELEAMSVVANWYSGTGALPTPVGRRYAQEIIPVIRLFLSPKPLFFDDTFQDERMDPNAAELCRRQNIRALAVLPLWVGARQLGVLLLEAEEVHHFTEEEIQPYIALARQMATAVDSQQLLKQAQERARALDLLNEVNQALLAQPNLELALHAVTDTLVNSFGGAFARLWTLDEAGQTLILRASSGLYTQLNGGHARIPVGGQFKIGLIAQERRPYLTNDILNDPGLDDAEWARRENLVAFAGYPLLAGDRLRGVLVMFAHQPLAKEVITSLGELAERTAVALDNRLLLEETRRRAYREQAIRQITEKMQAANSLEELVKTTARELGQQFSTEYTLIELGLDADESEATLKPPQTGNGHQSISVDPKLL